MQLNAHGNSATATSATKLATARNIKLQGAVSGNANFDGSNNVVITTTQANIAVLTGTISTTPTNEGTSDTSIDVVKLNFPAGFTSDNCVVLSFGIRDNSIETGLGFETTDAKDPRTWLRAGVSKMITFNVKGDGKIWVLIETPFSAVHTYSFKVVLMKVS